MRFYRGVNCRPRLRSHEPDSIVLRYIANVISIGEYSGDTARNGKVTDSVGFCHCKPNSSGGKKRFGLWWQRVSYFRRFGGIFTESVGILCSRDYGLFGFSTRWTVVVHDINTQVLSVGERPVVRNVKYLQT